MLKDITFKNPNINIKIGSINLFQKYIDRDKKLITKIFNGIIIKTSYNLINGEMDIRLFGINLFHSRFKKGNTKTTLKIHLPLYFTKNSESKKLKSLYKLVKDNIECFDYDSMYVFFGAPSGEIYLLLNSFKDIMKVNKTKRPLFVVNAKFKQQLCNLYFPEIDCILIKNFNLYCYKQSFTNINGCKIYYYFPTLHYIEQDKLIDSVGEHYYQYICKDLKIPIRNEFNKPKISELAKLKIKRFVEKNNLKNIIMLCPEANTGSELSHEFWCDIANEFIAKGYSIYLNITNMSNYIDGCITAFFNYEETIAFTKYLSGIVGIRSGFIEILSAYNIPIATIYPDIPKRGELAAKKSCNNLRGFTLHKLPGTNSEITFEYDINSYSEKNLKNEILKHFNAINSDKGVCRYENF